MRRLATAQTAFSLHAEPSATSASLGTIAADTTITVIAQSTDQKWYQLAAPGGTGWGPAAQITLHCVLIADLYPFDNLSPNWTAAMTSPQLAGAILKASEGVSYGVGKPWGTWFATNWAAMRTAAGARYGDTWFRGAYHFYAFYEGGGSPVDQADYFLSIVEGAGGWGPGDLQPVVDVELGGDNARAADGLSASDIVDQISAFAATVTARLGCPVMLYGGEAMRDKKITSHMGCDLLWTAQYSESLSPAVYTEAGWTSEETVLWQYTDGQTNYTGFPTRIAGLGGDISVYRPNDLDILASQLAWHRSSEQPTRPNRVTSSK